MSGEKILIVEDDAAIARGLKYNLEYEGYQVRHASHGLAVGPIVAEFQPDLIILDVMLPGKSGFDILQDLRLAGNTVHVIILSAKTSEDEKVHGLTLGADDYVSKPFGLRELLARVDAVMRRIRMVRTEASQPIVIGDLTIYPEEKTVLRGGTVIRLTPKAMELLVFFARNPNRTYSRDQLILQLWQDDYEGTARTIDNFVLQIRGQIEDNPSKPRYLETVHGQGYRFMGSV